jgi:hypothetical protein
MTTMAQQLDAMWAWAHYAVTGGGVYPFPQESVRWGEQDFPRADTPLVTIDAIAHAKINGPTDTWREQNEDNVWATYLRDTVETTLRVEVWSRYSDTAPNLNDRADVIIDRIRSQFQSPGALEILRAADLGAMRAGDVAVFAAQDGASTLRAASCEFVFLRSTVTLIAEDWIESVEITGEVAPAAPVTFTVEA